MSEQYTGHKYWAAVCSIAQDAWDESGRDIEAARERAWESVDGSRWIIYYPGQLAVIRHCLDEHAGWDDLGAAGILDGAETFWDVTMRTAFYAMLRDVEQALQALADEDEEGEADE